MITIHQNQSKMSEISKFHPYNVLWAQLGDLYGSIGNPSRLAKTIVCGAHTVTINKVLSVLTYFVRCGEIQRVKSTKVFDKTEIEEAINCKDGRKKMSNSNMSTTVHPTELEGNRVKGLPRNKTCLKNIATVRHNDEGDDGDISVQKNKTSFEFQFNTSNFILTPPEIAYDNHRLETDGQRKNEQNNSGSPSNTIKLMVTSPNNDRFEYETASEALDFILKKIETTTNELSNDQPNNDQNENKPRQLLWSIDTVKDGIRIDKWKTFGVDEIDNSKIKNIELKRSHSLKTTSNTTTSLRRSRTVREIKSNQNFQNISNLSNEQIESLTSLLQELNLGKNVKCMDNKQQSKPVGSVVFVLGDNEVLSGLKTSPSSPSQMPANDKNEKQSAEVITPTEVRLDEQFESNSNNHTNNENGSSDLASTHSIIPKLNNAKQEKKKKHCTHKKHSGVKFNFEQYPQIVTNYMKNKNLDITNYDFLEKGLKLEQENIFNYGASSTSLLPIFAPEDIQEHDEQDEEEQCECCANTFRILQTPSNATELEFSNDDNVYPVSITKPTPKKLKTVIENDSMRDGTELHPDNNNQPSRVEVESIELEEVMNIENKNNKNENDENLKIANNSKCLELIMLPIPKTEFINDNKRQCRMRPGYVPSLFVGITDHFIPDMVLQVRQQNHECLNIDHIYF